jgi:hypothetical protein
MFQNPRNLLKILGDIRGELQQVPRRTNKRHHRTKFSRMGEGAPGICSPPPPNDMTLLSIVLNGVVLISLSGLMKQRKW